VVHFLLQFPLLPCNPKQPREPVQVFAPLSDEHAFIVKGRDAKERTQIHVFLARDDATRDRWIAMLNRRSLRHQEALEKNIDWSTSLGIDNDLEEGDEIDPELALAMKQHKQAKAELQNVGDMTEADRAQAQHREQATRAQLNAMHSQLVSSVQKAEAIGAINQVKPTGKSVNSPTTGRFNVGDHVHIGSDTGEMWQVFEVLEGEGQGEVNYSLLASHGRGSNASLVTRKESELTFAESEAEPLSPVVAPKPRRRSPAGGGVMAALLSEIKTVVPKKQ